MDRMYEESYFDLRFTFWASMGNWGWFPTKSISALITNPEIINRLPMTFSPFMAIILPDNAIIPPVIIAVPLLILLVRKPSSPAMVGTINAPEKMVNAISSDWMID
jgi:hypothetical protein